MIGLITPGSVALENHLAEGGRLVGVVREDTDGLGPGDYVLTAVGGRQVPPVRLGRTTETALRTLQALVASGAL